MLLRAGADDKPLRMVKTVLHELVKLRGTAIKGHLSMVPIDTEPQPIILAYIDLNLQVKLTKLISLNQNVIRARLIYDILHVQTLAAARMLTPSGPMGQTNWGDTVSNSPTPATHSADAQLKVFAFGANDFNSSIFFMEKNAAAGRTPSSLPMSTPPPLANLTSPKFGALSPVCTKSLSAKSESINSNVAVPYAEDDAVGTTAALRGQTDPSDFRPHLGDDRMDRYPAVTMGTLDAIRERMKSIQAAAAAGSLDGSARPLAHINSNVLHEVDHIDGETPAQINVLPMDEKALSGLQARMERLKSGSLEML
ncbi:hypothetical protein B296_00027907 [Ensete ventricosum]|uniref:Uncharacterized protein n=1 Tax=Ensete ventricosum TaxID=4639 RepID=A0A426ZRA4_ENSVE|nr:hypothetical protein B296_00027907 [Ensete ventricosum]